MTLFFAQTAWLVPLYPLVAALASLAWSPGFIWKTGPRPCGYLNLTMVTLAFAHSLLALLAANAHPATLPLHFGWTWLHTAGLSIGFDGSITQPALIATLLVTGVHVLAQIFAIGYLEMDWGWPRFFG